MEATIVSGTYLRRSATERDPCNAVAAVLQRFAWELPSLLPFLPKLCGLLEAATSRSTCSGKGRAL
jgi:hypothetical protein